MAKKIFFGNYKGGVGKTTTVFEIGAQLANNHRKKVLLIDLDPQCSLSKICEECTNLKLSSLSVTNTLNYALELYGEYIGQVSRINILEGKIDTNFKKISESIKNISKHSNIFGRLDFIPTVLDMKNSRINDIADRFSENPKNILVISRLLNDIENSEKEYDYILIDCPPTSNIIIQSVFLACDYYLIPTVGDEISTDGVADYITEIESTYLKYAYDNYIGGVILKYYFGDRPQLIGVLETLYKNRSSAGNIDVLTALDRAISAIKPTSLITNTNYTYKGMNHIFDLFIRHLDNRSNPSNYGIPITVSNGDIHSEYDKITQYLVQILK
jgi:chromosome partitioning protein